MAKQIIECVPNFSEGRSVEIINKIVKPFSGHKGCALLDYRADRNHNRLVVSLAGSPEPIKKALFEASDIAVSHINMELHEGGHPRIGAIDVIPFTPIQNITMDECVDLARDFGKQFNGATGIPVYFYDEAALKPNRRNLEVIRKGQYETLKKEIANPERAPDIGDAKMHESAGATIIGARKFLIAFNVNLGTNKVDIAKKIANNVRASGGGLCHVKGIGLSLKDRNLVQVSLNITDHKRNAVYRVLELVKMEAKQFGIQVVETELYGMAPASAIVDSSAYYMQLAGFDPNQIIELRLLQMLEEDDE